MDLARSHRANLPCFATESLEVNVSNVSSKLVTGVFLDFASQPLASTSPNFLYPICWSVAYHIISLRLPEFESLVESILENSLLNLLTEANHGEVNLTSRTRVIALPPNRAAIKSTR